MITALSNIPIKLKYLIPVGNGKAIIEKLIYPYTNALVWKEIKREIKRWV
jgi:hypothetical protein